MSNSTHYDVIIIGSGAGGGTLAYRLAPSGKKILILERGESGSARLLFFRAGNSILVSADQHCVAHDASSLAAQSVMRYQY